MPRSCHVQVTSSAGVQQVMAAFSDEAYWRARLEAFGNGNTTLDTREVEAENGVMVVVTIKLPTERLPGFITRLREGDLELVRSEQMEVGRGRPSARRPDRQHAVAPVSAAGEAVLIPTDGGSRLAYNATVDVRIPLIGGRIESYISGQAGNEITEIQTFTTDWIAANR